MGEVNPERDYRRVPMERLTARLGLTKYNVPAPLKDELLEPKTVKILLIQHIGALAKAEVQVGEFVTVGQVIGRVDSKQLGVNLHASIEGTVVDVNEKFVTIQR